MRSAAFVAAMVGTVMAAPQAVTSAIAPNEKTPDGCQTSYSGKFQVVVSALNKRSLETRQDTPLEITLKNGVMTDDKGRTGYIASNQQFQFDGPAQAGAIYTSGWSVCANNSIALGNSAIFYQCLSGTFYNLYDENEGQQCSPVYLNALGGAAASTATTDSVNTVICQIGDGQIQQNTCVTTATAMVVTQISDGQIQAPTGVKVSQITDGQVQVPTSTAAPITSPAVAAPTGATITQISDGQVQAPTGAVVTQVSDGQIQAPTNGTGVVTPTPTAATTAAASASASSFTGAAAFVTARKELFGLAAAGAMAVFAL